MAVPGVGWGGGGASNASLRFLKTIKDTDMKLTPLIKRREYCYYHTSAVTSHDVTKASSWIFMAAILDF